MPWRRGARPPRRSARERVRERFGVVLEPEVQVLGEVEWPAEWGLS